MFKKLNCLKKNEIMENCYIDYCESWFDAILLYVQINPNLLSDD